MPAKTKSINWGIFGSSFISRLSFWGSTIYIIYLCVQSGYSLTTLHVSFFTAGCGFLMVEATLVVTGDALLSAKVSKEYRIAIHWILHTLGLAALIVGLATIVIAKNRANRPHFTSDHGKVGISATVIALIIGVAAIPTLSRKLVPQFLNYGSFKRTHIYWGIISMILLWAGQITGFSTGWWSRLNSKVETNLTLSAYVIGGFFLLVKPLYMTLSRSFDNN